MEKIIKYFPCFIVLLFGWPVLYWLDQLLGISIKANPIYMSFGDVYLVISGLMVVRIGEMLFIILGMIFGFVWDYLANKDQDLNKSEAKHKH